MNEHPKDPKETLYIISMFGVYFSSIQLRLAVYSKVTFAMTVSVNGCLSLAWSGGLSRVYRH